MEPSESPQAKSPECENWWTQPAGGREVLNVALPLVVSSLSWTVMTFVDRLLLKWESGDAMAAAFAASTVWFAVLCLPLGVVMYSSTFVSQYFGANRYRRIGLATWQGVWVALLASPLVLMAIPLAPMFFAAAKHESSILELEIVYFQILCWGAPAMLIGQALSSFYSGRGQTRVVMVVDTCVAGVNVWLDWIWIFGYLGFPAMGIVGAGWATVASLWLKVAIYLVLVLQKRHRSQFGILAGLRFDPALFSRLLKFGGPSGLQLVLDVSGFTLFVLLIGRLGGVAAEASSMAFSISTLAFMPVWGMSLAASILVGQHLGENRDDLAARATWNALGVAMIYMSVISLLYLFVPDLFLAGFFAGDTSASEQEVVREVSITLLKFVAAYNLLDAMAMVFSSAVKGAGDTTFVLKVSVVLATLLGLFSWLAVEYWQLGIYGCWVVIASWVGLMGVVFMWRFLGGKWRSMRVIELELEVGER